MSKFDMKAVIIHGGSKKVPEIESFAAGHCASTETVMLADAAGEDLSRFDVMLLSGGPSLFTDPAQTEELKHRFRFIADLTLPMLGICLGHQAIGITHGARVYRGPEVRQARPVSKVFKHPLWSGIDDGQEFAEDHCEGIELPQGFELLGRSRDYPVEIMANDSLKRYGVQFHPEVSGEPGRRLMLNFLQLAAKAD